jgi:flagellar hook-associated protein 2
MSGITTGTGVFSGIDSRSLIDQLLQIEARPRQLAQRRVAQLQQQQTAYLDINSRLLAVRTAANGFRTDSTFKLKTASTNAESVATATAANNAAPGSYTFRIDRLVSSQQMLSRGFGDRATTGMGLTGVTLEGAQARLDADVALAELNNGAGVQRGRIVVTDSGNRAATIDLSKAVSVEDVLAAINTNGVAQVSASVEGGRFVVRDAAGGTLTIANAGGSSTATSLGIAGSGSGRVTGGVVYGANVNTALAALNDGRGVGVRGSTGVDSYNFEIVLSGATTGRARVNLGDVFAAPAAGQTTLNKTATAVSTLGGAVERMNSALTSAGLTSVRASIDTENSRIVLSDTAGGTIEVVEGPGADTTAADLGLTGTATGTMNGRRVLAGLNSSLVSSLRGGTGFRGDGVLNITSRDGTSFSVAIDANWSLNQMTAAIEQASGSVGGRARVTLGVDERGTGLSLRDNTAGTGNLVVQGTPDADTAASLGLSTGALGVASSSVSSGDLDRAYVSRATQLSTLNGGRGIGTGTFRVFDSAGAVVTINIGATERTLGEVIDEINANPTSLVRARVNASGDGLELFDTGTGNGRIRVEDATGTVAKSLNIAGTASGTGVGDANALNGSFERTIALEVGDSLDTVVRKINDAGLGVQASVVSDGSSTTPFRLTLSSAQGGKAGRFVVSTAGNDLGLSTLSKGEDAVLFYGGGDVSSAIVATSSSNTFDAIVPGLRINAVSASANPVTISVAGNTAAVIEKAKGFATAFNEAVARIDLQTRFDQETNRGGPLLGDGTALNARSTLYRLVDGRAQNITGRYTRLADVGINVGSDGKLIVNEERLTRALNTDAASVEALFTARVEPTVENPQNLTEQQRQANTAASSFGVMQLFGNAMDRFVNSVNGVLSTRNRGIDTQVRNQNARISDMTARLDRRRTLLEAQFASMESTIGRLQTQGNAVNSIGRR